MPLSFFRGRGDCSPLLPPGLFGWDRNDSDTVALYIVVQQYVLSATAIPSWKHQFPQEHWSWATWATIALGWATIQVLDVDAVATVQILYCKIPEVHGKKAPPKKKKKNYVVTNKQICDTNIFRQAKKRKVFFTFFTFYFTAVHIWYVYTVCTEYIQ